MPTRKRMYAIRTATKEISFSTSVSRAVSLQREMQATRTANVGRTAKRTLRASRFLRATLGRAVTAVAFAPDVVGQMIEASFARTASVTLEVFQATRKFVGHAGLIFTGKRRWDRRPRRR